MSILSFHASKLYRQQKVAGYTDDDGNYHQGKTEWKFCCTCDVVPAGEANKLVTSDGSIDYYSYEVHNLPVGIEKFSYGDFIKLDILGAEEVIIKVKGFHRYQLQCKIWA